MFSDNTTITSEGSIHEQIKEKRARRIASTNKKRKQRMKFSQVKGYPKYPYYVKSECVQKQTALEVIPECIKQELVRVYDEAIGKFIFHIKDVYQPPRSRKRTLSFTHKEIAPYLKQYCRTNVRAEYKRLAVRKERYTKYEFAPSARSYYKRIAEVDWLAW